MVINRFCFREDAIDLPENTIMRNINVFKNMEKGIIYADENSTY